MEDKRTALLETAIQLFAKNGFWNTSTAQIAREARVATGTLFNYFPSKDSLISAVHMKLKLDMMSEMHAGLDKSMSVHDQLKYVWDNAVVWAQENTARFNLLEQLHSSGLITPEIIESTGQDYIPTGDIILQGINEGSIINSDVHYLLSIMLKIGNATLERINNAPSKDDSSQFSDEGFSLFWKAISL
ncbi:MAG: TetR/AcrR family transcriptional regulator [Methyloligellaceae bacterium]